jgi:hypothetical protein
MLSIARRLPAGKSQYASGLGSLIGCGRTFGARRARVKCPQRCLPRVAYWRRSH